MNVTLTTYDDVRGVLVELGIEPAEITPDAQLRADLGVDSAELVEIATRLAPDKVDGKALKGVRTVADLVTLLEQHP